MATPSYRSLLKLEPGTELPGKELDGVTRLEKEGLLAVRKDGRSRFYRLTEKGDLKRRELEAEQASAAQQASAAGNPRPRARARAGVDLEPRLASLEATLQGLAQQASIDEVLRRLDALAAAVAQLPRAASAHTADGGNGRAPVIQSLDAAVVRRRLLDAIADLDFRHRYGGLIPIPDIRRSLSDQGISDDAITRGLEELERDFSIDLNVAQSPTQVPEPQAGIQRPGRGLLYYVTVRPT